MIRTVIAGASGRMGQSLLRLLPGFAQLQLHGAVVSAHSSAIGKDAGVLAGSGATGIVISSALATALQGAQLLIDFSAAEAAAGHLALARAARVPMLLGTTGLPPEATAALEAAGREIPVLAAANTSIGVALLAELVRRAATALGSEFNIEIAETHHRHKLDAPSGTALMLAEVAANARQIGVTASQAPVPRGSQGPRRDAEIGVAVLRGGDVVGEHEVQFLGPGERLVLRHSATDRAIFARGALRAGLWLAGQGPGRYQMADVFNL
jgi:4-hydroxy-tetrahydrodipicolinate reductase